MSGYDDIEAALRASLPAGLRIHAVVDAARCLDLAFEAKLLFGMNIHSLFAPDVQTVLWNVSPYAFAVDSDSPYLRSWALRLGESAGILIASTAEDAALYDHLRKLFVVQDEQKQEFFFRFYDPRVLNTFLPTCSPAQLAEFFGPIDELIVEDARERALLRLRCAGGRLVVERSALPHDSVPAA